MQRPLTCAARSPPSSHSSHHPSPFNRATPEIRMSIPDLECRSTATGGNDPNRPSRCRAPGNSTVDEQPRCRRARVTSTCTSCHKKDPDVGRPGCLMAAGKMPRSRVSANALAGQRVYVLRIRAEFHQYTAKLATKAPLAVKATWAPHPCSEARGSAALPTSGSCLKDQSFIRRSADTTSGFRAFARSRVTTAQTTSGARDQRARRWR